jgi:hypothetical protein
LHSRPHSTAVITWNLPRYPYRDPLSGQHGLKLGSFIYIVPSTTSLTGFDLFTKMVPFVIAAYSRWAKRQGSNELTNALLDIHTHRSLVNFSNSKLSIVMFSLLLLTSRYSRLVNAPNGGKVPEKLLSAKLSDVKCTSRLISFGTVPRK